MKRTNLTGRMRRAVAGTMLLATVAALVMVAPVLASPPGKTNLCSVLDGALATASPGTQAFHNLAGQALTHGCVAYVANARTTSLELELIRGPNAGTAITIGSTGVILTDLALTSSGTLYGIDFGDDYLMSVSILNIGRYIAITMVPTMPPTAIIRIGSMIDVSDAILASTSSS